MSDLISRAELKKTAKRIASMPWGDWDGNRVEFEWSLKELEQLIDKAPSAEPKKGKWIIDTNDSELINCSCCRRSEWSECFEDIVKSFNYCPNCGAKMEAME